jgi:hypothetical protein
VLEGRSYDVRDIGADVEAWMRKIGPIAETRGGGGGLFGGGVGGGGGGPRGGGGGGLFIGGPGFGRGAAQQAAVQVKPAHCAAGEELARLISETVYLDQWSNNGGPWQVEGWGGWIYVRAPPEAHRVIERLLFLVRRAEGGRISLNGARS